jgi:hypothetical protein
LEYKKSILSSNETSFHQLITFGGPEMNLGWKDALATFLGNPFLGLVLEQV